MKSFLLAVCVLLSVSLAQCQAVKPVPITGFWQGTLEVGIPQLLEFSITEKPGGWDGDVASLYAGDAKLPLAAVKREGQTVRFELGPGFGFIGTLNEHGNELKGSVEQGGAKYPLLLKRSDTALVLKRPQQPKPPFPYRSEVVEIASTAKEVKLAGTLTLPPGAGPHPAVVLITGSGPQDRDEFIMAHRPFAVLADHLTRQGIAVLRCDERGVGKSIGNFATSTTADFAEDIRAEWAWLRARPEIDKARVGLVGHSEGGIIAPLVAAQEKDVAFIVLLAGVGVPMRELALRQAVDMARVNGATEKMLGRIESLTRELISLMQQDLDDATLEKRLRDKLTELESGLTPEERAKAGDSKAALAHLMQKARDPQQRWFMRYDPAPTLRAVQCPVLALNGRKDVQVAVWDNLAAIKSSLAAGGNKYVKIVALKNLNHLFQNCQTGSLKEYGEIEETIAPNVLEMVGGWVRAVAN